MDRSLRISSGALVVGLVAGVMYMAGGEKAEPADEMLTVEQTLRLPFVRSIDMPMGHLYARSNPEAKQGVRRLLADKKWKEHRARLWSVLGYIGDKQDVGQIERTLRDDFSGVLEQHDRKALTSMLQALGLMWRRGVDGSCDLLFRMQDPVFWRDMKFRYFDRPMPQRPPFEQEMLIWVMQSYALTLRPDLDERVRAILDRIDDPNVREMMAAAIDPKRLRGMAKTSQLDESRSPSPELLKALGGAPAPRPEARLEAAKGRTRTGTEELRDIAERIELDGDGEVIFLALSGPRITDEVLGRVGRLSRLSSLNISLAPVTNAGIAELGSLRSLRRVGISRCRSLTDEGLAPLEKLVGLEHLELHYLPGITDAGLAHVKGLAELDMLEITEIPITDEGLKFLGDLRNLKRLYIYDAPIRGDGLKHLKGLSKLEILLLRGTRLNDDGLKHLEGLTGLQKLVLGMTTSDSYRDEITAAGLAHFKRALPRCTVERPKLP